MKLTAEHVGKTIHGTPILQDIHLTLESGTIYGFVGRNGSGKTMLFRALSGLMKLSGGTVSLGERVLHRDFAVLPSLGIVLEHVGMYPNLTGVENLRYLANLTRRAGEADIRTAIERVGLNPDDKRTYRKYSLGMKQRLAIAQAIMERPDVLMLDEPTNGLDDDGVHKIRELILAEKARGAIILLASHNQEDIRILSDHLFRIEQGRLEGLS